MAKDGDFLANGDFSGYGVCRGGKFASFSQDLWKASVYHVWGMKFVYNEPEKYVLPRDALFHEDVEFKWSWK